MMTSTALHRPTDSHPPQMRNNDTMKLTAPSAPATYSTFDSPIGEIVLTSDGQALSGLYVDDFTEIIERLHAEHGPDLHADDETDVLSMAKEQLGEYFAGSRTEFDVPLAPRGTEFQRQVWQALTTIPYGATAGYGELAGWINRPSAARAVGAANGRNPISIIVPCHRVVGANGALTGYAWGEDKKRALLQLEAEHASTSLR